MMVDAFDTSHVMIRTASEDDLNELLAIEISSWGDIAVSGDVLLSRLRRFPSGQFVATVGSRIVGSIYTQLIVSIDDLFTTSFDDQGKIHAETGSILQLLSVAVLGEFASLQIGKRLRDEALRYGAKLGLNEAVAMTRCSTPSSSVSVYWRKVLSGTDPTLQFHLSAGAKVLGCIPRYRINDKVNFGHSVIIHYEDLSGLPILTNKGVVDGREVVQAIDGLTLESLVDAINGVLSAQELIVGVTMDESFADTPFMSMGLDSLGMMDLRGRVQALLPQTTLSPTILFDHPTPRKLLHFICQPKPESGSKDVPQRRLFVARPEAVDDIVIAGVGCRCPGGADNPEDLFSMLCEGRDLTSDVPKEWTNVCKSPRVGFLTGSHLEAFDPAFFGLSAAEASAMDPHQRLLLEVVHEALVDANILDPNVPLSTDSALSTRRIGIFVGICNNEWIRTSDQSVLLPYSSSAFSLSSCANRVSFIFGLTGPSMVIDTACSSSLVALHVARKSLQDGDCDIAVVASADLVLSPFSLQVMPNQLSHSEFVSNRVLSFYSCERRHKC